jgi:general secretion pathway protein G
MVRTHLKRCKRPSAECARGFTLIEMVIVIAIITILLGLAVPNYITSQKRALDSVMKQNLFTMRQVIQEFTLDKQRAPQSLDELSQAGYMKEIPKDPCTGQRDWAVVQEDVLLAVDQNQPGITDVHSSCALRASDGTPYSEW